MQTMTVSDAFMNRKVLIDPCVLQEEEEEDGEEEVWDEELCLTLL